MQAFFEFLVLVGGTPKRKPHGAESQKGRVREDAEQLPDIGQYAPEGFSDPVAGNGNPTNTTNVCLFACIQLRNKPKSIQQTTENGYAAYIGPQVLNPSLH
jgi:hypothetical protein